MTDVFEAKPGTAVHMPLLSEALINFAFNQAQEFVESGNSVREATSICANLLLDAAWKVAGAGAAADGFEPNKDKFRARVEDVLERVSFSKLGDEDASSNQPSASADPSPLQPPPTGMAVMEDGALNLAFVANALRFYANHIEGHPQRGDYFPADLRLAAEMLVAATPPPQTHVEWGDWTVDDTDTAREIMNYLGYGSDASREPGADRRRDKIAAMIRARIDAATAPAPEKHVALSKTMEDIHSEQLARPRFKPAPQAHVQGPDLTEFRKFVDLIEARAMACDGPVTPFFEQVNAASDAEKERFTKILAAIYQTPPPQPREVGQP